MVKYIFTAIMLVIYSIPVAFAGNASPRSIVTIKIDETGKSEDETKNVQQGCQTFAITTDDVKDFFSKSYPVPLKFNTHDRYSPCYSKGTIEFNDNTRGTWKIYSSGGGTLYWDTGDIVTLFYSDYKWADPFEGMYTSE